MRTDWHRLLGLLFIDALAGSPYEVDVEYKVNQIDERLDILLVRSHGGPIDQELPDGLEDLRDFNLFTFKSIHEPLNADALGELIEYFYALRKLFAKLQGLTVRMLPAHQFRCFAISTRFPQQLHSQKALIPIKPGVYKEICRDFEANIIVTSQIPVNKKNAIWNIFSGDPDNAAVGAVNYEFRIPGLRHALTTVLEAYDKENIKVPYTIQDFQQEFVRDHKHWLTPDERLEGLSMKDRFKDVSVEDRLEGLPADDVFKRYSVDDRIKGLPVDDLVKNLSLEDRFKGVPMEQILAYVNEHKGLPG